MELATLKALFLTPRNLIIIVMAWALSLMVGKILPNRWKKAYQAHVMPALLLVACSVAVWVPGLRPGLLEGATELAPGTGISGDEIGWRIALGIILSVLSYVVPTILMWFLEKKASPALAKQIRRVLL